MKKQGKFVADFTTGPIVPALFRFALPLFLGNLLQVVYNMVDMIVVGQSLGKVGLSAVSIGGDVSHFLTFIAMGFAGAGQVIISQYIGAGKKEQVSRFISTMFTALLICAAVLGGIFLIFCEPILHLMNTPAEAFAQAKNYAIISIIGTAFIYGYNVSSAVLRGMGDSRHPFLFISIASVINIVLDLIFVIGFGMGAGGAALATIISQAASFIACMLFVYRNREKFELEFDLRHFFFIDRDMMAALIKLGLPMAIKSASIQFSKLFVNSYINSYGVAVSAFSGVANKVNSIANLVSGAINTAGSSMVGQNIGAQKYERVPRIVVTIGAITLTMAALMSAAISIFPNEIYSIFTSDAEVLSIGIDYIPIAILIFAGSALRAAANALINGSGNYRINFATAILDGIVMRIGLGLLFGLALNGQHLGFWLGDAIAGFTPFVIGVVFYITGKWKRRTVA